MKKSIFSLLFSLISFVLVSQTIYTLNISGVVTDEVSGDFLEDKTVVVSIHEDSVNNMFSYFSTVLTNSNGYFEDIIEVPTGEMGEVFVGTLSCDGMMFVSGEFSENNNALSFSLAVCTDSIGTDCEAWFNYQQTDVPLNIAFNDCSAGNPVSWAWNFGDGETSLEENPIHEFSSQGQYIVSLEIIGDDGNCSSIVERSVFVGNDSIPNGDCQAMYFYYQDSLDLNKVNFMDMSIGINGLVPSSWSWSFGDGSTSEEQNPIHTYAGNQNEYSVCLFISSIDSTTGESCEDAICTVIYLQGETEDCEAYYYYYPVGDSNTMNSFTFHFIDNSWGNPTVWLWEFGDGSSSTEQYPFHEFAAAGIYDVCLSIYSDSCESIFCQEVYVMEDTINNCFTWFEYEIEDLTVDLNAFFENGDVAATYTWDFGDGITATGTEVEHTYAAAGSYEVVLTAVANNGECVATYFDMLWVGEDFSFPIKGYVFLTDSIRADFANIYLSTFDTIGNNLVNVATTQVDSEGYYEFEEMALENCIYFVQAELTEASSYYGEYIPTYHLSAANWFEAWPLFPFPGLPNHCVWMIADSAVTAGEGMISGLVNSGGGRNIMSNIEILLLDENGNPITYLRTDEYGEFQFPNLPYGTYVVHTEIVGVNTIPVNVSITEDENSVDIIIEVSNGEATLGIERNSAFIQDVGNISPNPTSESARLNIVIKETSSVTISVLNQYGQILNTSKKQLYSGQNEIKLQSEDLPQGVYFVNIVGQDGIKTARKFIKLR